MADQDGVVYRSFATLCKVIRLVLEKGAEPNADFDVESGLLLPHTIVLCCFCFIHAPLNQLEVAIAVETKTIVRSM